MAYKFQRGEAILSGALLQEGNIEIEEGFSFSMHEQTIVDTSRNLTVAGISGSGNLQAGGTVRLDGVADATAVVADDMFYIMDDSDSLVKAAEMSAVRDLFFGAVSGDATVANGGALTIAADAVESGMLNDNVISGQTELAHADIVDADELMISDGGVLKKVGLDSLQNHYFAAISGDATVADGGALTIAADSVEGTMLNTNSADGSTLELSSDSLSVLKVPNALSQGEGVTAFSFDGSGTATVGLASSVAGDGLGYSSGVIAVQVHGNGGIELASDSLQLNIDGMTALGGASIAQADEFAFSDDGTVKKVTFSNFEDSIFANVSGQAALAAGGALSLDVSAITAQTEMTGDVEDADELIISDGGVLKRLDFSVLRDAVFADVSGDAAVAAGGALTIAANAVEDSMVNDNVATGLAGVGLAASSGVMSLDLSELSDVAIASGDKLAMLDATDSSTKLESIDDIATLFAGNGLSAASAVLALDLNELTGETLDVAADSFAFIDATDNSTKKESIADLVSAMAGAGLTATSGVLKVTGNDVHLKADGDTLQEGYNYFADISSDAGVTLPASPTVGDVVHIKAGNITGDDVEITVTRAGSQTIDGDAAIYLESPFAAVSLVYVASDAWRIV